MERAVAAKEKCRKTLARPKRQRAHLHHIGRRVAQRSGREISQSLFLFSRTRKRARVAVLVRHSFSAGARCPV
jgi:hypothetical protein